MAAETTPQQVDDFSFGAEYPSRLADTDLLWITVVQHGHAAVVAHVAGEVDMLSGPSLQRHLVRALATRPECLIVDLSQVSCMGATGLAVLINAKRDATQQGTTLQLRGISSAAALPLQATELAYLFDILPPVEESPSRL